MIITETQLKDCLILQPEVYKDNRGTFFESYNKKQLDAYLGRCIDFVQNNHSISHKGVLRGLHYQVGDKAQAKLVRVVNGAVLDVVVDIRKGSETYGQHVKLQLSAVNKKMVFIPRGMAHGFLSLTDGAEFVYKCDNYYNKEAEAGIIFNDKDLNIDWEFPAEPIICSEKDKGLPAFNEISL